MADSEDELPPERDVKVFKRNRWSVMQQIFGEFHLNNFIIGVWKLDRAFQNSWKAKA